MTINVCLPIRLKNKPLLCTVGNEKTSFHVEDANIFDLQTRY